jgi:hypothetical protein
MQTYKRSARISALLAVLGAVVCPTLLFAQSNFQILNVPFTGIEVSGISATATNDVWTASGSLVSQSNVNKSAAASLNFNGTKFSKAPLGSTVAGTTEFINGVAAIAPDDVWAVGFDSVDNGPLEVVQRFDGTKWQEVHDVAMVGKGQIFGEQLNAISAINSNDIFAAGNLYNYDRDQVIPFFEHWNGQSWAQAGPNPKVSNTQTYINGVAAISASDVWAVGYAQMRTDGVVAKKPAPATLHFDGTQWKEIPAAKCVCVFTAVAAIASDDVWAVGNTLSDSFDSEPMAQHWDGTRWTLTKVPSPEGSFPNYDELEGVAAVSSKSVWAVGTFLGGQGNANQFQGEIAHWDGKQWTQVTVPACPGQNACGLFSVTALSTGEVWAGGTATSFFDPGITGDPLILFTNKGQ